MNDQHAATDVEHDDEGCTTCNPPAADSMRVTVNWQPEQGLTLSVFIEPGAGCPVPAKLYVEMINPDRGSTARRIISLDEPLADPERPPLDSVRGFIDTDGTVHDCGPGCPNPCPDDDEDPRAYAG